MKAFCLISSPHFLRGPVQADVSRYACPGDEYIYIPCFQEERSHVPLGFQTGSDAFGC